MPKIVMRDVMDILHIRKQDTLIMHRSNDRPNVRLTVRELLHPANSFLDLAFLIPEVLPDRWKPPKFLVFFDNISESIRAAHFLRTRLPMEKRSLVKWFNSDMSAVYREDECEDLKAGRTWGLTTTDSFGMGLDLADVDLVIQWRVTCDLCTLWQRFGRAGRDQTRTATAVLFAETKYFDANKPPPQQKKRKSGTQLESGKPTKAVRRTKSAPSVLVSNHPEVSEVARVEGSEGAGGEETDEYSDKRLVELYGRPPIETPSGKGKTKVDIEEAMDAFINAATRPYLRCHRKPVDLYYGNKGLGGCRVAVRACERLLTLLHKESDEKDCRPDLPSGCPRCVYKKPTVCCEGPACQPEAFMDFAPTNQNLRPKPALPRSRIKPYEVGDSHRALKKDLHDFRVRSSVQKFGRPAFAMMGHGLVMSDETLQRIVDCADQGKIQTAENLSRETRWIWAREFFPDILQLIHKHFPPAQPAPLTTSAPLQTHHQNHPGPSAGSTTQKPKRRNRCGACKMDGHIGMSL